MGSIKRETEFPIFFGPEHLTKMNKYMQSYYLILLKNSFTKEGVSVLISNEASEPFA